MSQHALGFKALNLKDNKLRNIERSAPSKKFFTLKILSISDNKVTDIRQTGVMRNLKLEELKLIGSSFCTNLGKVDARFL